MRLFTLFLLLISNVGWAASDGVAQTPRKVVVGINANDVSNMGKRVCFYQDMAYSLGAILQIGEHELICKEANHFETNGQLKWFPLTPQLPSEQQQIPSSTQKVSQLPN